MASRITYPIFKAFDTGGNLLAGGKLYTYEPGTTTAKTTYSNAAGTAAHTNPIILDATGEKEIFGTGPTKLVLKDENDVTIWTKDSVYGIDGGAITTQTIAALRLLTGESGMAAQPLGYYAAGDGGGGPIRVWSASSTATDNGGSVIKPTAIGVGDPGRWLWEWSGAVNAMWFGVKGDGTTDNTAIFLIIKGLSGNIYFPAGIYLTDPFTITNPELSTTVWTGSGSGYNGTLAADSTNVATIRCRAAGSVFIELNTVHRFQMRNISIDGDGLVDTVWKLKQNCTHHTYDGCAFVNAKATTGVVVQLGDPVNSQVDWNMFKHCFWQNTKAAVNGSSVNTYGTNTINNTFLSCRFASAIDHITFGAGSQTNIIDGCDFQAHENAAIASTGNSSYHIRHNYTESATGTYFFIEGSIVYQPYSGSLSVIENNLVSTANASIEVSANKAVIIRGNRSGSSISVTAPTDPTLYYPPQIYDNQLSAAVFDPGNYAAQWNNIIGDIGLTEDSGQLIAVKVGDAATAATTFRRAKKPIQLGALSLDGSAAAGYITNNYNGDDLQAYSAGYGTGLSFGVASGYVRINSTTTAATNPGDVVTVKSVGYSGANASFEPGSNNESALGRAGFRWSEVFATNGTVNTSDAKEKQQIRQLSEKENIVAVKCKELMRAFKRNDDVIKAGDSAKIHFGIIAQDVVSAFESEGLNAFDYNLISYEEWEDQYGEEGQIAAHAGSLYGIRYSQLLSFIISAL